MESILILSITHSVPCTFNLVHKRGCSEFTSTKFGFFFTPPSPFRHQLSVFAWLLPPLITHFGILLHFYWTQAFLVRSMGPSPLNSPRQSICHFYLWQTKGDDLDNFETFDNLDRLAALAALYLPRSLTYWLTDCSGFSSLPDQTRPNLSTYLPTEDIFYNWDTE